MGFHIKKGVLLNYIPENPAKPPEELVIPDGVTEIGKNAFIGNKTLRRVQLPDGLLKIGDSAFYGCTALKEITLPEGLVSVGVTAFGACKKLRWLQLPDSLREIGSNAFGGTEWLRFADPLMIGGDILICYAGSDEELILPDGLRVIAANAMKRQHRPPERDVLRRVVIPEGVEEIGTQAFRDSAALEEIVLPQSLKTIGESAFINCTHLRSVTLPEGLTEIPHNLFYGCQALTEIRIPQSVTEIGANAFYYCTGLQSVSLPAHLRSIGATAFAECKALTDAEIPAQTVEIGANVFQHTPWETEYPADFIIHGDLLMKYKGTQQAAHVPEQVRRIGDRAFEGRKITELVLPQQLTEIGAYAFSGCTQLNEIVIPASVRIISENAFAACKAAKTVRFEGTLPDCGKDAFAVMESLAEMQFPDGTVQLAEYQRNSSWGYYYRNLINRILTCAVTKKDINQVVAQMMLDCFRASHAPSAAKMIRRFADTVFIQLDKAGDTDGIIFLLSQKELLTEKMLDKMLEYAIGAAQKSGSAEHQMLVMRAKEELFDVKEKRFHL